MSTDGGFRSFLWRQRARQPTRRQVDNDINEGEKKWIKGRLLEEKKTTVGDLAASDSFVSFSVNGKKPSQSGPLLDRWTTTKTTETKKKSSERQRLVVAATDKKETNCTYNEETNKRIGRGCGPPSAGSLISPARRLRCRFLVTAQGRGRASSFLNKWITANEEMARCRKKNQTLNMHSRSTFNKTSVCFVWILYKPDENFQNSNHVWVDSSEFGRLAMIVNPKCFFLIPSITLPCSKCFSLTSCGKLVQENFIIKNGSPFNTEILLKSRANKLGLIKFYFPNRII